MFPTNIGWEYCFTLNGKEFKLPAVIDVDRTFKNSAYANRQYPLTGGTANATAAINSIIRSINSIDLQVDSVSLSLDRKYRKKIIANTVQITDPTINQYNKAFLRFYLSGNAQQALVNWDIICKGIDGSDVDFNFGTIARSTSGGTRQTNNEFLLAYLARIIDISFQQEVAYDANEPTKTTYFRPFKKLDLSYITHPSLYGVCEVTLHDKESAYDWAITSSI